MYVLFNKSIVRIMKEKNSVVLIIFLLLLSYGLSESYLYKVSRNAFLLYFSYILDLNYKNDNVKNNKEMISIKNE